MACVDHALAIRICDVSDFIADVAPADGTQDRDRLWSCNLRDGDSNAGLSDRYEIAVDQFLMHDSFAVDVGAIGAFEVVDHATRRSHVDQKVGARNLAVSPRIKHEMGLW